MIISACSDSLAYSSYRAIQLTPTIGLAGMAWLCGRFVDKAPERQEEGCKGHDDV